MPVQNANGTISFIQHVPGQPGAATILMPAAANQFPPQQFFLNGASTQDQQGAGGVIQWPMQPHQQQQAFLATPTHVGSSASTMVAGMTPGTPIQFPHGGVIIGGAAPPACHGIVGGEQAIAAGATMGSVAGQPGDAANSMMPNYHIMNAGGNIMMMNTNMNQTTPSELDLTNDSPHVGAPADYDMGQQAQGNPTGNNMNISMNNSSYQP